MPIPATAAATGPAATTSPRRRSSATTADQREHDREQEPRPLEEGEVGVVEVEPQVGARQRAREQGGQEGPDAAGGGEAGALARW